MTPRPIESLSYNRELKKYVINQLLSNKEPHGLISYFKDEEDARDKLSDAFDDSYDYDGYSLAKILEIDHNIDSDSTLVDILNSISYHVRVGSRKMELQWVIDNRVTPKLKLDDTVKFEYFQQIIDDGKIVKVDTEFAEYYVTSPTICTTRNGVTTKATIIKFENLERWNPKHEE